MLYVSFYDLDKGRRAAQASFDMAGRILTNDTFRLVEEWLLDICVTSPDIEARFHFCEGHKPEPDPFLRMRGRTVASGDKRTTVLTIDDKAIRMSSWNVQDINK